MEIREEEAICQVSDCLQGRIRITLPQGWQRPSNEILARKFPYRTTPQEVFSDTQAEQIITFSLLDKQLQEKQVYTAVREIQRVISHIYPESIREQARMIRIQAGPAGIFAFITGGIREDVYHSMFILSVDEKMLLGSFHLPEGQAESGRKTRMDIMRSIEFLNTQKNTEAYKSI